MNHRIWVNGHQGGPDALRLAASLGVGGVRVDGNMEDLWPSPDRWTHGWLDELLATCQTLGLQVYLSLSHAPAWLSPNRGDLPPLHDWQIFCAEIARYYAGRVTLVGIWNEWPGSGEEYVRRLLRPAAEIFRAAHAGFKICGPDLETERDWPQRLTDVLTYGADCLDVLTVHCYQSTGEAVWSALTERRPPRPGWLPAWVPWWTPSIRQVIDAAGWRGPVWVTETGWRSEVFGDEGQTQRWDQLLARFSGSAWPAGICIYQLLGESPPDRPPVTFGVYASDGTPKLASRVIQRYTTTPGVA